MMNGLGIPRKITGPYEVLGLDPSAGEADVRAACLRLAKKHHPDKNPGDKASEWIFKQVQSAYETLRDANDVRSAERERPTRSQEDNSRTRAERGRQRQQQAEETEREEYEGERQQAEDARHRWERARAKHNARGDGGTEPVCDDCGGVARWWTSQPRIVRLFGAWAKWALTMACILVFAALMFWPLELLLTVLLGGVFQLLSLPERSVLSYGVSLVILGSALLLANWLLKVKGRSIMAWISVGGTVRYSAMCAVFALPMWLSVLLPFSAPEDSVLSYGVFLFVIFGPTLLLAGSAKRPKVCLRCGRVSQKMPRAWRSR